MKIKAEISTLPDGRYSLTVDGEWFDDFESLEAMLNTLGNLVLLSENPMTADFVGGLMKAKVIRDIKPKT